MKVKISVEIEKEELMEIVEKRCPEVKGCKVTDISSYSDGIKIEFEKDNEKPPLYTRDDEKVTESDQELPKEPDLTQEEKNGEIIMDKALEPTQKELEKIEDAITLLDMDDFADVVVNEDVKKHILDVLNDGEIKPKNLRIRIFGELKGDYSSQARAARIVKKNLDSLREEGKAINEGKLAKSVWKLTTSDESVATKEVTDKCERCGENERDGITAKLCRECRSNSAKEAYKKRIEAKAETEQNNHSTEHKEEIVEKTTTVCSETDNLQNTKTVEEPKTSHTEKFENDIIESIKKGNHLMSDIVHDIENEYPVSGTHIYIKYHSGLRTMKNEGKLEIEKLKLRAVKPRNVYYLSGQDIEEIKEKLKSKTKKAIDKPKRHDYDEADVQAKLIGINWDYLKPCFVNVSAKDGDKYINKARLRTSLGLGDMTPDEFIWYIERNGTFEELVKEKTGFDFQITTVKDEKVIQIWGEYSSEE